MNRGDVIGETLESIITQLNDEVEIVVLDGASADNTPEVVESYRQRFPTLRYLRQPTNGGVDKDYDLAVQAATGEYCWLMSDDDLLVPDAVATVLSAIDRAFSLIVVNAEIRTRDMSKILETRRLQFDRDREYGPDQLNAFFTDAAVYMSFIGCIVIRRSIWMERNRERYFGTVFIHMGVVFQSPLPGSVLIIARPLISIRWGNALWRPKEFEIWMFKWPVLLSSFGWLDPSARDAVCQAEPWRNLKALLVMRAKGTYSVTEYRKWIEPRLTTLRERLGARTITLIPGIVANLAMLAYTFRGNRKSMLAMTRIDLMNSRYYFCNWFNASRKP
jgi:abequosyltransferase